MLKYRYTQYMESVYPWSFLDALILPFTLAQPTFSHSFAPKKKGGVSNPPCSRQPYRCSKAATIHVYFSCFGVHSQLGPLGATK
jgi:hypothetical protein